MQTDRIALVTGANKGIGLEIARQIGKSGHRVLLGARNATLGEAAASALKAEAIDVRFVHIDLGEPASIVAAANMIETEFGRLDSSTTRALQTEPMGRRARPASTPSDVRSTRISSARWR